MPRFCGLLIVSLLTAALSAQGQSKKGPSPLTWEPAMLVNGSPVLFRLNWANFSEVKGGFLGQEINFRYSGECHCWYAFAGVGLETKPGVYTLQLSGQSAGMADTSLSFPVKVHAAHYPFSTITVAPAFVEPPKEVQPVIAAADAAKKQAFAATAQTRCGQVYFSGRQKQRLPASSVRPASTTARRRASIWGSISTRASALLSTQPTREL